MTGDRLQLGLGCGSTQADFDLVGADYTTRFKSLMPALDTMRRAWRGETLDGGTLTPWPGTEGGPALLLGAWRNKRWIVYAAEQCQGWIASGLYPKPEELEAGIKFYRDAGGKRAVLSNVIIDLHGDAADMPLGGKAQIMLTGGEAAARDRLRWIRDVGFEDVLCMARPDLLDDLARLRDAIDLQCHCESSEAISAAGARLLRRGVYPRRPGGLLAMTAKVLLTPAEAPLT